MDATREPILDLRQLLGASWRSFTQNPTFHVLATLVLLCVTALTLGLATGPCLVSYVRLIERDRASAQPTARPAELWQYAQPVGPSLALWTIMVAAVALGCVVLVLPGVALAAMWCFAPWYVAVRGRSATDALRDAWQLTRGAPGPVLTVLVMSAVLVAVGTFSLLGAVVALPLAFILLTLAFHELAP